MNTNIIKYIEQDKVYSYLYKKLDMVLPKDMFIDFALYKHIINSKKYFLYLFKDENYIYGLDMECYWSNEIKYCYWEHIISYGGYIKEDRLYLCNKEYSDLSYDTYLKVNLDKLENKLVSVTESLYAGY